ncbi:Carboxylesterase NlhH [Sinobacterium norvegicum]|uniref:Carboxylesterase NlhH n=1 Tax=Sinobacterium norvegicum TaxID=1641715 RepID=A0ABN8EHF9_9GAMM|nr:alpha/beta hydrolase [Sinobacterium norvegicum]CAH0991043.1 Carboxylesterase NlhH [Sinobacterium norvegicum]
MLDHDNQKIIDILSQMEFPSLATTTPEEYRRSMAPPNGSKQPVAQVTDTVISAVNNAELALRIYRPSEDNRLLPAVVYFHGGGFVVGDIDSHDSICRALANLAQAVIISVDYRLAPEHKFPAATEDGYQALQWVYDNHLPLAIDSDRISLAGDSAGANLATVTALLSRDRQGPKVQQQLLLYPCLDPSCQRPSFDEFGEGYFLGTEQMQWFWQHYLDDVEQQSQQPYVNPLFANLSGLPPATLITAGCDPLRDEGADYGKALSQAGVAVDYQCVEGQIHGFCSFIGILRQAQPAIEKLAAAINR